jgi:5-methyltetrahydrofolate--homocysteine methyltransferase
MKPMVERLGKVAQCYVHAYPNAGLPNAMGGYDETPEHYADSVSEFAKEGLVNMLGGCCGTTPPFIQKLAEAVAPNVPGVQVRTWENKDATELMMLSGLQEFIFTENIRFINIGERCNIAGSIQFKKMIKNNDYDKAVDVAKKQVENGA